MSLNQVQLIGNLGADIELQATPSGNSVCTLSLATSDKWKDSDGTIKQKTQWHRVIVWGKVAENCSRYLSKGSLIFVQGRIQTKKYQDKHGIERYSNEVVASKVNFLQTDSKLEHKKGGYISDDNADQVNDKPWNTPF